MQESDFSVRPQVGLASPLAESLDALLISLELRRRPKLCNLRKMAVMIFPVRVEVCQGFTDVKEQRCLRHPTTAAPCGSGIHSALAAPSRT